MGSKIFFYYFLKYNRISLTIMSHVTENCDKIQTSVFKGIQRPEVMLFNASPIPNLTWRIDLGKPADQENTRKTKTLQVCEEIWTF